jgi:hypothetical protein
MLSVSFKFHHSGEADERAIVLVEGDASGLEVLLTAVQAAVAGNPEVSALTRGPDDRALQIVVRTMAG